MIRRVIFGLLVALGVGAHTSGSAGPVFVPFFTAADWAITEVDDPTGLAPVAVVQRFEVRPGQCISTPPFHDCERGVERAELGKRSYLGALAIRTGIAGRFSFPMTL